MSFGKAVSDASLYVLCIAPFVAWAGITWHAIRGKNKLIRTQDAQLASKDVEITRINGQLQAAEVHLGLCKDEVDQAVQRWEMAARMVSSYGEGRTRIIENLRRFGMTLDKDNEIVVVGHPMYPAIVKDGVVIKPAVMVPVMAKGLEPPAPPPHEGDLVPIICWYRLVPDPKIKGQINEEFSHYEDAEMTLQDPKNRKNTKMIIKLPTTSIPSPRGGTKFSGKWAWRQMLRTTEMSPKVLPANYEELKKKASARLKELREELKDFPDSGPIFGKE